MILINGQKVDVGCFPNGEILLGEELVHFVSKNKDAIQNITLRFEDNADFMSLLFVSSWMKEEGYTNQRLVFPYLPYSRMDRKVSRHLFSLKYIADFINTLNFVEVIVLEAHSDVSLKLINNSKGISYTRELIEKSMEDMSFNKDIDVIVFPDAGARKRYADLLIDGVRVLEGEKKRNFDTGEIVSLDLIGNIEKPIRNALIVDDLCSRGGTFIQISSVCKNVSIKKTYLAVTHLESNVYSGRVFDQVEKIYTTDALEPFLSNVDSHGKITVFDLPKNMMMNISKEEK